MALELLWEDEEFQLKVKKGTELRNSFSKSY